MASCPLLCWPFWSVLQESPRTGPATAAQGTSSTPTWSWPQPTSPPPDPGWPRLLLYPGSSPTPPVRFLMPTRHHLLNSAPCRDTSGTLVSQGLPTQRLQKEPFNILPATPPNAQPLSTSHLGKPCPAHSWTGGTQPTPHQPLPLGSPVPPPNPPCSPAPLAQETARLDAKVLWTLQGASGPRPATTQDLYKGSLPSFCPAPTCTALSSDSGYPHPITKVALQGLMQCTLPVPFM